MYTSTHGCVLTVTCDDDLCTVCAAGLDDFIAQASSALPSRRRAAVAPQQQQQQQQQQQHAGLLFGGYSNLHGEILTIPVTKVNKKLGMAIDGGANTKQQAITIRQITVRYTVE